MNSQKLGNIILDEADGSYITKNSAEKCLSLEDQNFTLQILFGPAITELVKWIWMGSGSNPVPETRQLGRAKLHHTGYGDSLPTPLQRDSNMLSSSPFCKYLMNCMLEAGFILFVTAIYSTY